jgi:hypothetical protein
MAEFMEALSLFAIPAPEDLPFLQPTDPADILFHHWITYSLPQTVDATLDDFPDKKKVLYCTLV